MGSRVQPCAGSNPRGRGTVARNGVEAVRRSGADPAVCDADLGQTRPMPDASRSSRLRSWDAWAVHERVSSLPLFWRVFATNAIAMLLAFAGLVFAPVTVSVPVAATEVVVLAIGLVVLLLLNLALLRPAFRPLDELAETMRRHDPLSPGERVPVEGEPDVAALAQAFNDMLERLESERRESARQALRVLEGERSRIARELHDEVGQTLTGVMLQVEALAARIPEELREQLEELRETARSGTEEVRRIASQLRPEALEDLGLLSALAALATAFAEQAGIAVERRLASSVALSEEQELVVYRVAQEALTNIARHAGATRVEFSLAADDATTVLTVRDDGRGLAPGSLPSSRGIRGMRERAMLIGAKLQIDSHAGRGTQIQLSIPTS
jgi:two-component system, NarL family, sensor histidine kinase UhpB